MKLSFCVIKSPIILEGDGSLDYTIFITKYRKDYLDSGIRSQKEYNTVTSLLKKIGYSEVDDLRFEFVGNHKRLRFPEIIKYLRDNGLSYGKKLEQSMVEDAKYMSKILDTSHISNILQDFLDEAKDVDTSVNTIKKKDSIGGLVPSLTGVEQIEKDISINFYLVFDFVFVENDFIIDVNGSFSVEKNKKYRHYVKILEEKFNIKYHSKNDEIVLTSKKTKEEITRETSFLHNIGVDLLKFQNEEKTKKVSHKYMFNTFDILRKIRLDDHIIIKTNKKEYNNILNMSKSLRNEMDKQKQEYISIEEIEEDCVVLIENNKKKMLYCAEIEQFNDAHEYKVFVEAMESKLKNFKQKPQKFLNLDDIHKFFNLKD